MKFSRPNYGISRIDQPEKRNHGWFVRITLKGEVNSKFFADKSYQGKAAALIEARRHRDSLVKKLPKDRLESLSRRRRHVKKSGIKGITHVVTQDSTGHKYEYWQAAWRGRDGRRHSTKFSIAENGEKRALDLAKKHLVELGLSLEPRGVASKRTRKK
ncbi:MAG: hypothetical protein ACKV19_21045 [Verrucomicrobiales bacterium]